MQKLRAITEQLNSDFKGIRKDAPMFIWFQLDPCDLNRRLDQIMFFADGDFQSTLLYDGTPEAPSPTGSPVVSNIARIQYCHARVYSPTAGRFVDPCEQQFENAFDHVFNINHRTLARRQHLLTADSSIVTWPDGNSPPIVPNFQTTFDDYISGIMKNDAYEHDCIALSQWQALANDPINYPANVNQIIAVCFGNRPQINFQNALGLYMLMAEGVSNFTIQLADESSGVLNWLPVTATVGGSGVFFNIPAGISIVPRAIKFTFTLYDSRGVFKEGQTFTHIVYLGD
jgi:hypothetical protein